MVTLFSLQDRTKLLRNSKSGQNRFQSNNLFHPAVLLPARQGRLMPSSVPQHCVCLLCQAGSQTVKCIFNLSVGPEPYRILTTAMHLGLDCLPSRDCCFAPDQQRRREMPFTPLNYHSNPKPYSTCLSWIVIVTSNCLAGTVFLPPSAANFSSTGLAPETAYSHLCPLGRLIQYFLRWSCTNGRQ